jgi:uncharacterized protein involved in outer membrane biogenesis
MLAMLKRLAIVLAVLVVLAALLYVAASRILASDLVRSTLQQQLATALGQPVSIAAASAAIYPRVAVDLHSVAIGDPVSVNVEKIRVVTGLRPLLSRRVEDAEVILNDGELRLPLAFDLVPAGSAAPAPGESPALTIVSIRVIELRRVALVAGDQRWLSDADCRLEGDRLDIIKVSAQSRTTRFQGSGALTSISRNEGELTIAAKPLDLDELMTFVSALSRPVAASSPAAAAAAPTPVPVHLTVKLTAPAGQVAAQPFRDLATTATITTGAFSFSPLTIGAFGGRFDGRLDADSRKSVPVLRLNGRLDDLDVAEAMKAAGSQAGGITGRLGGSVSLAAAGTDSATLLRTARGSMSAVITNGTMPKLDLVRPIVLAFGKPSGAPPEGSGSGFSRLGGSFALSNGVVSSKDIAMAARDFDVTGEGSVELASGALSARGNVALSQELTAQAGVDLRRYAQEDGRVVVPATVHGTLQQPAVALDVAAATRRALENELERRAKSFFGDLFKRKKQ